MKLKRDSRRSSGLKVHVTILFCLIFVFAVAGSALAATKLINTVDGLTATLSVSPAMALNDVKYLKDGRSKNAYFSIMCR